MLAFNHKSSLQPFYILVLNLIFYKTCLYTAKPHKVSVVSSYCTAGINQHEEYICFIES